MPYRKATNEGSGQGGQRGDEGDQYDRDLARDSHGEPQEGRDASRGAERGAASAADAQGMRELADRIGSGAQEGRATDERDQHARRGQAQSPVQTNHFEPPRQKEGH